ncbi:MAG: hypothetical protein JXA69_00410 [Phycisphaerae bacterium]|nr:hypothetical protein [Phycisphaerae bacterium]
MRFGQISVLAVVVVFITTILVAAPPAASAATPILPRVGVTMKTDDPTLQRLFDAAEKAERGNVVAFAGERKALVEGGGYSCVWLETQPMGGAMYAKRNLEVALNNQLLFIECQRADGRLPGVIVSTKETQANGWDKKDARLPPGMVFLPKLEVAAYFAAFSGYCFPSPALDVYYLIGRDREYLERLYRAIEAHDAYLWRTRDSNGDGILELWCVFDNGEDNSARHAGSPASWPFDDPPHANRPGLPEVKDCRTPFASMDVMAWSYESRRTLAEISAELGNGKESHWREQADDVQRRLVASLWRPEKHACYDRDKDGRFMDVLLHNNLRCMWFRAFTQEMADAFIRHHLLNPDEFWTPMPLPSIAANDPLFQNTRNNNWSGQPQGLTYQRAIRALENYGHFAEVTLIGQKLLDTVGRTCRFRQQYDPFTGDPDDVAHAAADYGPTILAVLEYISRMHGVHIDRQRVLFSGLARGDRAIDYTQRWGEREYALKIAAGQMVGSYNGQERFRATAGVRIVTDLDGRPREIVGISPETESVTLRMGSTEWHCDVPPNTVWTVHDDGPPTLARRVAFEYPYRKPEAEPAV